MDQLAKPDIVISYDVYCDRPSQITVTDCASIKHILNKKLNKQSLCEVNDLLGQKLSTVVNDTIEFIATNIHGLRSSTNLSVTDKFGNNIIFKYDINFHGFITCTINDTICLVCRYAEEYDQSARAYDIFTAYYIHTDNFPKTMELDTLIESYTELQKNKEELRSKLVYEREKNTILQRGSIISDDTIKELFIMYDTNDSQTSLNIYENKKSIHKSTCRYERGFNEIIKEDNIIIPNTAFKLINFIFNNIKKISECATYAIMDKNKNNIVLHITNDNKHEELTDKTIKCNINNKTVLICTYMTTETVIRDEYDDDEDVYRWRFYVFSDNASMSNINLNIKQ